MEDDLPFSAEYAKSGRASCKKCRQPIDKDSLRMAIMVQSPKFDGKMPMWHHLRCFFQKKNSLRGVSEIANFNNLRWDDQEKIKNNLSGGESSCSTASKKKGSSEFSVEYAKSNRSTCPQCEQTVLKGEVRISKIDTESDSAKRFGPLPRWHHVDCFVEHREELEFFDSADKLPGFKSLTESDKDDLKEKLPAIANKRKNGISSPSVPKKQKSVRTENKVMKEQNELFFKMRDQLRVLSKKQLSELLELNDQYIPIGEERIRDHLADCLVFGALKQCSVCKNGVPRFKVNTYMCPGHLTEWTKCSFETKLPERKEFTVPEEHREMFDFLKNYKCVVRERQFADNDVPSTSKKSPPLVGRSVVLAGNDFSTPKDTMSKWLAEFGAQTRKTVTKTVSLCISTEKTLQSKDSSIAKARLFNIHVVSPDIIDALRKETPLGIAVKEHKISDWGDDPISKFAAMKDILEPKEKKSKFTSKSYSSSHKTMKIQVHGKAAVDPESGLEFSAHVYQKSKAVYNVVLNKVDINRGQNSYYKLQILKSNHGESYHLFRSWGRVGTTIGGKKCESLDLEDAIEQFKELYLEKTGNDWSRREKFQKKPGFMYPIDIDYGEEAAAKHAELKPGKNSKLPKPVQELICLIFDIEAMKKAMLEFEIDLNKMPLGKISKKQIEMAYKVLKEAQSVLSANYNKAILTDLSNRFFTLIPHDFGMRKPPLLDNEEIIKSKSEMLDSLLEIEFAYNLIKKEKQSEMEPIDEHYKKLKTDIKVLDKMEAEFKIIEQYLHNTHAETHNQYSLKLLDVFKIDRSGEKERYQKFKDMHNKKLLWHGSRLTNFVGILSQGLRIAPPEAPVSGYMFGKGVYFADMVSKSANYCCTSKRNSTGILLLCEVALGNMYERTNAEYVEKLPKQKHSTFGMGRTVPDPAVKTKLGDAEVPYGKPVSKGLAPGALLYNEYIVYDVNQINIKYLLKVDFKWKY